MILSRRTARWLVPLGVLAGTAGAVAVPALLPAGADPVPVLPELTAAELVDKVRTADVTAFSGDVRYQVDLGLPDLGGLGAAGGRAPASLLELLSGSRTAHVAVDGPDRQRIALDGDQSETDWIHNGRDLWSWDSTTSEVTHITLPEPHDAAHDPDADETPAVTPADATEAVLATLGASTDISVRTPGYVADRPVYELVIAPKAETSTVAAVVIGVDATTGMALELRVEAADGGDPAVQIGFTSISYDRPDPATFAFTPPPGATVTESDDPRDLLPFSSLPGPLAVPGSPDERSPERDVPGGTEPGSTEPGGMEPSGTTVVGTDWSTMLIIAGATPAGTNAMIGALVSDSPTIATPSGDAHLISTRLLNVLFLPDGRIAVAAMDPAAMVAALPA